MVDAVCRAADELGLPENVLRNMLKLVESVEKAVHEGRIRVKVATPIVDQAKLLDSLIEEYCSKL